MKTIEVKTFTNEEGHRIVGFFPIDVKTLAVETDGDVVFQGSVMVGTSRGPADFAFEFPEGYMLEKCFEEFEAIAQQALEEKMEEQKEQQRIVTPGQTKQDTGGIIAP